MQQINYPNPWVSLSRVVQVGCGNSVIDSICNKVVQAESASCDKDAVEPFRDNFQKLIKEEDL